jgi:hypothetical protein
MAVDDFPTLVPASPRNIDVDLAQNKRGLFHLQSGDCVHDALAQARVQILVSRLNVGLGKVDRFADDNGDGMKMKSAAARQRFVRAENSYGHDWRESSRDDQSKSGLRRLQLTIECARSFRKNESAFAALQDSDQRFECAAIDAFLIDGNDVELRQEPAKHGHIK